MRRFRGFPVAVVATVAAGCGWPGASAKKVNAPPFRGETVVVAAVGDGAVLPTVSAQRGEWEASRGASCRVVDTPVGPTETASAHVLVFRGERLGDLIDAGALAVLPESLVQPPVAVEPDADAGTPSPAEADPLQFADVIPAFRDQVSKYGNDRVAFPYGGSALVLVYNRAAFVGDRNRAEAKASGIALEPSATWKDLDRLAGFLHGRDWDGDGADDSGIALALGPDPEGVGDATFLARAASQGQHRDHYSLLFDSDTMEPRVETPPFVEALADLVALKAFGPKGAERFDAEAAAKAFREGRVALLIDRAERAGRWGGGKVKAVGVAQLPGSGRVYEPVNKRWETPATPNRPSYLPHGGGWLVGVAASANGRQREAAIDFITYLVNPETSYRVRSDQDFPMLPVRGSQVAQGLPDPKSAPGVESRVWSEAVGKTLLAARVVPGLRIPQADGYLADLSKGRVAASGGEPPAKAMKGVADAWNARTKALGLERQVWHYRRSLNSLVTTTKPPPRQ